MSEFGNVIPEKIGTSHVPLRTPAQRPIVGLNYHLGLPEEDEITILMAL